MNVTMAKYAELNIEDTSAFLGLESHMTGTSYQEIKNRRKAICEAVLSEQARQWEEGIDDPEKLASISEVISDVSRMRGHIIGLLHADKWYIESFSGQSAAKSYSKMFRG